MVARNFFIRCSTNIIVLIITCSPTAAVSPLSRFVRGVSYKGLTWRTIRETVYITTMTCQCYNSYNIDSTANYIGRPSALCPLPYLSYSWRRAKDWWVVDALRSACDMTNLVFYFHEIANVELNKLPIFIVMDAFHKLHRLRPEGKHVIGELTRQQEILTSNWNCVLSSNCRRVSWMPKPLIMPPELVEGILIKWHLILEVQSQNSNKTCYEFDHKKKEISLVSLSCLTGYPLSRLPRTWLWN